jgi:hypothetical protein
LTLSLRARGFDGLSPAPRRPCGTNAVVPERPRIRPARALIFVGDMPDALSKALFDQGGLIAWASLLIPGFIAWRTLQARRPQGEQKAADAIMTIATFGFLVTILWSGHPIAGLPKTWVDVVLLILQTIATPIVLAFVFQYLLDELAKRGIITSSDPRAWDYIFNTFAPNYKKGALFFIVTLNDGTKIAGVYGYPGLASLWPYDRDLFLGQLWELDEERRAPIRQVTGSIGIYLDRNDIQSIEVLDYTTVIDAAVARAAANEGTDAQQADT